MTLRRAGQKRGVVVLTRSKEDECPSVSLDLSCDSSSFDSDDCATRAEKVSDLVLPHILGVSPCNYDNVSGGGGCHTMLHKKNFFLRVEVTLNRYRSSQVIWEIPAKKCHSRITYRFVIMSLGLGSIVLLALTIVAFVVIQ